MEPARKYTQEYLICPHCNDKSGCRIDHLYGSRYPQPWGDWGCDACGGYFRGEVTGAGEVLVEKSSKQPKRRVMTLLKLDRQERPVFFVMDHWRHGERMPEAEAQENECYFYEEHSCPTNWLGDCVAVIEGNDMDPHGFLEFVRSVEVPIDFEEDDDPWREMFPEAFTDHDEAVN